MSRKAILQVFMMNLGGMHMGAWRDPQAPEWPAMNFEAIKAMVQRVEAAKIHAFFMADSLALYKASPAARARQSITAGLEHFTLVAALAPMTSRVGFVVTGNTTYNHPYHLARKYASLDHISGGRIGWNAVTSGNPSESANFAEVVSEKTHDDRYARAAEFIDVAKGLWDSWDEDAFVRDREGGVFTRESGLHSLDHQGEYFSVAGPLTVPRPPQGYPVIYQAGQSEVGRAFAAKHGEVMISMLADIGVARSLYTEMGERVASEGRAPGSLKILANVAVILGETTEEAQARSAQLDSFVDPVPGLEHLSAVLNHDMTPYPLDEPVPEIPLNTVGSQGVQAYFLKLCRNNNLTLRQAIQLAARAGARPLSAADFVNEIEEWLTTGAADGFNVGFADFGRSLEVFTEHVVPELQRRGLFRLDYEGETLRENLGLERPVSRYAR